MKKFFLLATFTIFLTSCATLFTGTKQHISIHSNVNGADVFLNDRLIGRTPLQVEIKKQKNAVIKIKKDGYETRELKLITNYPTEFWLNVCAIYFFPFSSSTDSSSGAIYEYVPNSYYINLDVELKNAAESEKIKKQKQLRYFVIMNFDRVNRDISLGKGDYLDSIYEIYGAKNDSDKIKVLHYLKEAQTKSESIPDFANTISSKL